MSLNATQLVGTTHTTHHKLTSFNVIINNVHTHPYTIWNNTSLLCYYLAIYQSNVE